MINTDRHARILSAYALNLTRYDTVRLIEALSSWQKASLTLGNNAQLEAFKTFQEVAASVSVILPNEDKRFIGEATGLPDGNLEPDSLRHFDILTAYLSRITAKDVTALSYALDSYAHVFSRGWGTLRKKEAVEHVRATVAVAIKNLSDYDIGLIDNAIGRPKATPISSVDFNVFCYKPEIERAFDKNVNQFGLEFAQGYRMAQWNAQQANQNHETLDELQTERIRPRAS